VACRRRKFGQDISSGLAQDSGVLEELLEKREADGEAERDDHQQGARGAADGESVQGEVPFVIEAKTLDWCVSRQHWAA
jgi:hypothetical protein